MVLLHLWLWLYAMVGVTCVWKMLAVFDELGHCPCAVVRNNAVHGIGVNILAKSKFEKHVLPIVCVKF